MSESGDYVPAPNWVGVNDNFKSARVAYDDVRKRSYDDAAKVSISDINPNDHVPASIKTNAEAPLVIITDVTGSMGEWPGVIFSKLPYLEFESQEYLGDDMEISFAAVGDAPHPDKYPLQVLPFAKGKDLKSSLEKLIHEGGGGGTGEESYELAALYYARNCEMPEAIRKPVCIFIGDEGIYSTISTSDAKTWARVDDAKLSPEAAFKQLKEKFSVYIIRKPYNCSGNNQSESDQRIQKQWIDFLGDDHVVSLPNADRVVDVIFGILAKETGRIEYFEKELKDRQGKDKDGKDKIAIVMKSLVTMHKIDKDVSLKKLEGPKGAKSKSVTPSKKAGSKKGGSTKSISLLDD